MPALVSASLEIRRGLARRRRRPIYGPLFLVGSGQECDLVLGDLQFADVHFYIRAFDGNVSLRHLDQSPDVTVNGRVATTTRLMDGDRIRTGPYEFVFRVEPFDAPQRDMRRRADLATIYPQLR